MVITVLTYKKLKCEIEVLNLDFTLSGLATDSPYKNTLSCVGPDPAVEESQAGRRKQGNRILRRDRFGVSDNCGVMRWRMWFS